MKTLTQHKLWQELFGGWTRNEAIYAWFLIGIQVAFYVVYPESPWGFIAGVTGTICVLFVAKGKISNYFFGFIQTGIMMVLGFQAGLIGETGENIFYFVSQFWGIKEWKGNMNKETHLVVARKLNLKQWIIVITILTAGTLILGYGFDSFNGTQPYIDSFTLVTALVAQVLMVFRYRAQWTLWIFLNVVSLFQWVTLGNMSLAGLYVAFLINSAYGYINYTKLEKQARQETK